jgi:predicted ArsR family transcriptional regulator
MAVSTRERVLKTLLRRQRCTINDLAKVIGINPISIRHHLVKLEAEGLVASEDERHGVGRPRRIFFLTDAGLEHFPTRYLRLTVRLLEQMKEHLPAETIHQMFTRMAEGVAEDFARGLDTTELNMEERLELLKDLLAKEGFTIEWKRVGDEFHIREVRCPYYRVGQSHPEVCSVDQALISAVLDVPAEKAKCILDGDDCCVYVIPEDIISPEESTA